MLEEFQQHTVADSICEAEYIATSDTVKEAVWLQKFIIELGVSPTVDSPILLFCDSTGVITQVNERQLHQHTKHILCRIILYMKSWIEVTSSFRRSTEKRT